MSDVPPFPAPAVPRARQWLVALLGVGLGSAFNALAPGVAAVVPYMPFHLILPGVAWISRSLRVAWVAVIASALVGNLLSIAPFGRLTLSAGAAGAGAAFILIQASLTLCIVLLRRRMDEREVLLDQLRTERDRLLSLFAHAPIAVCTHRGPDLVYDFVSPGAQRLAQRPMLGRPLREVFADPEDRELVERVARVYRTGEPLVLTEARVRWRREAEGYVDATYTPLRDGRGRVEGVLACAVDVTARVEARRQLERTEQQLRRLSEAGLLGIAEWKEDRIVSANPRLLEILGYPPEAGVPEGGIRWNVITELGSSGRSSPFEQQFLRPDGRRIWILGGSTVVDPETLSGVAFVLDVTAQKEAERALQEAHQFEQRLLGIVSHDLRNPLASIRLGVDLLSRSVLSQGQLRTVTRMARSADRMHQLVAGLLDLTRLRAGQQLPISREVSNMHLLVERAVEEVSVADPGRITVTSQGDGTGEWDNVRVGQALGNLLGNALQHSPPSSQVRVEVEGGNEEIRVSIQNGGEPIPPEQREGLFEPFRRGISPGALDGSVGLGLYIAWHVAEAHGGSIEVSSSAEAGTTFRLILPKWASSPGLPVRVVG